MLVIVMAINFKKWLQRRLTYLPKDNINKHKHNYTIPCVLEITNKNIHASGNYYNKKEYYDVLKCNLCNSFIPNSKDGNISGIIIDREYDNELPLIKANTMMKSPDYNFDSLCDVKVNMEKK